MEASYGGGDAATVCDGGGVMESEMYDRSRRFAEIVQAAGGRLLSIGMIKDQRLAGSDTAQLIALALVTILPRVSERYTRIDRCTPQQKVSIPRVKWKGEFAAYLQLEMNAICPWGDLRQVQQLDDTYDHCIVIGHDSPFTGKHVVHVLASGWRCFVSEMGPSPSQPALAF